MLANVHQFPEQQSQLLLPGEAGNIELLVDVPRVPALGITAIICHPHPLMGGTMHNKVVTTMARTLRDSGINTISFNFRGVGQSEGKHDYGRGESADLQTIAAWLRQVRPADRLWLAGFSFGSLVALQTAKRLAIRLLIAIAPPVHYPEFATLSAPECPWILIQGEEDEVVNPAQVYEWVKNQQNQPEMIRMAAAGHFFHGHLIELKAQLTAKINLHLSAEQ